MTLFSAVPKYIAGFLLLTLAACYSDHTILQNAEGKRVYCQATGFGLIGTPVAYQQQGSCITKFETMGFHKQ